MDYGDATVRSLLDLEGLKQWKDGRVSGYRLLETAIDDTGFYDAKGNVTAADYRP
jgi:phosphonate transport system substrate-binding protein